MSSFQTTKGKNGIHQIFLGDIIILEMRYLFSPKNRRVKVVLFILLGTIIPAFLFHSLAYTTLEKKLYKQEHWREIYGSPPSWCLPAENPDLAVICGRVISGKLVQDERDNYLANLPLPNITVELWEQNPISPTGKLLGSLTNVFDSTTSNSDGRFQLTMRKVGPPNKSVYLVFKCGDEAQKPKRLDSWHDYWNINFQLGCIGSEDMEYQLPSLPYTFVDTGAFLGCNINESEVVYTNMSKQEQPTVNDVVYSQNFDHRHTQNQFDITLGPTLTNLPVIGNFLPELTFTSPGGWWEPDCLQKDELSVLNNNAPSGSVFLCNVTNACEWNSRAWSGGQLGDDDIVCDNDGIPDWGERERLTKAFYPNIPKQSIMPPYRRLDIRANLKDYAEEKYLGVALTSRLWGSGISDPVGSPHVFLRGYQSDSAGDYYISCEEFKKRNEAYKSNPGKSHQKNKYLNGGPLGGLAPESMDWERIYNDVINCDSTVTDPTNPAYCDLRKPDDFICNDYINGRYEQQTGNTAVRFCEIQPSFGDMSRCQIGDAGCGGSCGAGRGYVDYVLDKEYFSTEQMFANADTANSMHSNVFNDSLYTNYRQSENLLFNSEMQNQATSFTGSTRAAAGGGNKIVDGQTRNGQKGNSLLTSESIASIEEYVDGTETFAEPLTSPFTNSKDDYEDLAVWKIYEIGSPLAFCGVGDPWPHSGNYIDGPTQETLTNIQPDNLFRGNTDTVNNPGQLKNKAISTSTWYMSEDAINRDIQLRGSTLVNGDVVTQFIGNLFDFLGVYPDTAFIGLGGSVGPALDALLQYMPARDVFDSVLSMMQGDAKLHETAVNSGVFQIDIQDVLNAAGQIGDNSNAKVFGDRHEEQTITQVPNYQVEHPLSEENFAYIPGVSEGIFVLPPVGEDADESGLYGNSGTDGIPLMRNDWTSDAAASGACYPWHELPEGPETEICDSFREAPNGVSRTCRVDECRDFWLQETGTCTCSSIYNCWLSDSRNFRLRSGECTTESRLVCAQEQNTTLRHEPGEPNSEPEKMHRPPSLGGGWDPDWQPDPNDWLVEADCDNIGLEEYDEQVGGTQEFDIDGDSGPAAHRCNVSRAGPMTGGAACNGTLEIGDFALRLENRPPNQVATTPEPQTLDNSRTASLKINNAFLPPFQPTTTGSYIGIMNASHSDRQGEDAMEGLYTYGAEIDTAGYGNYSETSQYSTAPVPSSKNIPLEELYYHCHLRNYNPVLRGEVRMEPYLTAAAPYNNPDMGTVDDDGDGVFDGGEDADGNVTSDPDDKSWLCNVYPTPEPEWVEYTNTAGPCAISNVGACLAASGVPDTLPESYFDTINMAANLAQTPAGIIVAVMMSESGMAVAGPTPSGYWEDDFKIQMWGRPWYGKIDDGGAAQCDDNVWSAQSPYQILKSTFDLYMGIPAVVETFENLSTGRSNSASRCNFLDASIIAAYHLKLLQGGRVPDHDEMGETGDCTGGYMPINALINYSNGLYNETNSGDLIDTYNACIHQGAQ